MKGATMAEAYVSGSLFADSFYDGWKEEDDTIEMDFDESDLFDNVFS